MSKIYLSLIFTFSCLSIVFSQNDECENAIEITSSQFTQAIQGTFVDQTVSTPDPTCRSGVQKDVWYSFTAESTRMSLSASANGSRKNIGMQIFKTNCQGVAITCITDMTSWASINAQIFEIGENYLVRVFTSETDPELTFSITIRSFVAPSNDNCANATSLTPNSVFIPTAGTLANATKDATITDCYASLAQDVWYSFVANANTMTIDLKDITSTNTGFQILQGDCNGTQIYCGNPSSSSTSETYTYSNYIVGQEYKLRVYVATSSSSSSTFNIGITSAAPPVNDIIENAITIVPSFSCVNTTGNFTAATFTGTTPACAANAMQDLWYKFTATKQMMRVVVGGNQGVNVGFELYKGTQQLITCQNEVNINVTEMYTDNNFEIGAEYYIRVYNATSTISTGGFSVCVMAFDLPTNQFCADAETLTPARNCTGTIGSFRGAIVDPNDPTCSTASQEVWFKFVATEPEMQISLGAQEGLNHGLQVFAASCQGEEIGCFNNAVMGQAEEANLEGLIVNQTYWIRVYNVSTMNIGTFNICILGSPTETCPSEINITASNTTICEGQTITFTAVATNTGDAPIYQWLVNDQEVGTNATTFMTNDLSNGDVISLQLTSNAECTPTITTRLSNEIIVTVNNSDAPTFDPLAPICFGEEFTLPTTSNNGIAGTWSPAFNNQVTTVYTFVPTSICVNLTTFTVEVNPAITNVITVQGMTITTQSNGTNFQWINCETNETVQEGTQNSYTATTSGQYKVIASLYNCETESDCVDVSNLSIESLNNAINVYPNPTTSNLKIEGVVAGTIAILTNQMGEVIEEITLTSNTTLDVEKYSPGIYFLIIENQTLKIVKQ